MWISRNGRIDVIQELQSAYPSLKGTDYLLWSDFERALGEYDLDIFYSIKTLEVMHLVDCDVHIYPSTLRELRLRGLTLIQDDVTRCFVPRKSMYADRKINKVLANSIKAVDFGTMVEIPA